MILAMSDNFWQFTVPSIVGLVIVIFQWQTKREVVKAAKIAKEAADNAHASASQAAKETTKIKEAATAAAEKVAEVKTTLEENTTIIDDKLDTIHVTTTEIYGLTNSAMAVQLKLNAELSRWKAEETKDRPEGKANAQAAELAERMYNEHMARLTTTNKATKQDAGESSDTPNTKKT